MERVRRVDQWRCSPYYGIDKGKWHREYHPQIFRGYHFFGDDEVLKKTVVVVIIQTFAIKHS